MACAATPTRPATWTIFAASRSPTSPTCRASSRVCASPRRNMPCSSMPTTSRPSAAPGTRSTAAGCRGPATSWRMRPISNATARTSTPPAAPAASRSGSPSGRERIVGWVERKRNPSTVAPQDTAVDGYRACRVHCKRCRIRARAQPILRRKVMREKVHRRPLRESDSVSPSLKHPEGHYESIVAQLPGCRAHRHRRHDLGHRDGDLAGSLRDAGPCAPQPAGLGLAVPVRHLLLLASRTRRRAPCAGAGLDLDRRHHRHDDRGGDGAHRPQRWRSARRRRIADRARRHAAVRLAGMAARSPQRPALRARGVAWPLSTAT